MVAEECESGDAGAPVLTAWGTALDRLFVRIAHRFTRHEVRARVQRYLAGLLGRVERKNGWQVAEAIGEEGPQGIQRLLNAAVWDTEAVRDDLRAYVVEHLGDAGGVLIVDESGFPKKGSHSCGVATQYCGTLGRVAPCQVGVFLGYASARGMAFLDRALYLPRVWTADEGRRATAGVPAAVRFASKGELAKRMLARAFAADVPAGWVVADSLYGRAHHFRRFLEQQERAYVVGVLPGQVVEYDGRGQRAKVVAASLPPEAWVRQSAGAGSQGERLHDWACVHLAEPVSVGWARWLLVRQALEDPTERTYFRAFGPAATTPDELVRVAGLRWAIEEGLAQAKGEVGLDHVRGAHLARVAPPDDPVSAGPRGPRRHLRSGPPRRGDGRRKGGPAPGPPLIPLTVPEVRRVVLAAGEDPAKQAFLAALVALAAGAPGAAPSAATSPGAHGSRSHARRPHPRPCAPGIVPMRSSPLRSGHGCSPSSRPRNRPSAAPGTTIGPCSRASCGCCARQRRGARCPLRMARRIPPLCATGTGAGRASGHASSTRWGQKLLRRLPRRERRRLKCHCRDAYDDE